MKSKKLIKWLPGIVSELVAVIICIIYAVNGGNKATMYLELLAAGLSPFLVNVFELISKRQLHIFFSASVGVFVFLSCGLGSALGMYGVLPWWDIFLHGIFGFLCSMFILVLLVGWNGDKLKPIGLILLIFLSTAGVAALWEVWEYVADFITKGDSQRVQEAMAMGKSPVSDTMEDVIIALVGSALFLISLYIDKLNNYKLYSKLCGFDGFKTE